LQRQSATRWEHDAEPVAWKYGGPTDRERPMQTRAIATAFATVLTVSGVLALGGCSSSSKSGSETSTTTSNKALSVDTPEGQVTVALNGALPPGWPSDFPVPDGSTPKGSGSLANNSHDAKIGVFTSTESPRDAFDFYNSNPSLTVESHSSVGVGSAFVGQLELGGKYAGSNVVVVPGGDGSYLVITLTPAGNTGTSTPATSTST
jgi:hypothetical protein